MAAVLVMFKSINIILEYQSGCVRLPKLLVYAAHAVCVRVLLEGEGGSHWGDKTLLGPQTRAKAGLGDQKTAHREENNPGGVGAVGIWDPVWAGGEEREIW